jgi:hypothetical protein
MPESPDSEKADSGSNLRFPALRPSLLLFRSSVHAPIFASPRSDLRSLFSPTGEHRLRVLMAVLGLWGSDGRGRAVFTVVLCRAVFGSLWDRPAEQAPAMKRKHFASIAAKTARNTHSMYPNSPSYPPNPSDQDPHSSKTHPLFLLKAAFRKLEYFSYGKSGEDGERQGP